MDSLDKKIQDCLNGNELACKSLYQEFMPYGFSICRRYGVRDSEIKDHLQIIFSAVFKSLGNFDKNKSAFKTWFTRICINKIIDQRRTIKNKQQNTELTELNIAFASDNNNKFLYDHLDRALILKALNEMPTQFKSVFNMAIIEGYSHAEIAEILNISQGSSRITLKRARDWAKQALTEYLKCS